MRLAGALLLLLCSCSFLRDLDELRGEGGRGAAGMAGASASAGGSGGEGGDCRDFEDGGGGPGAGGDNSAHEEVGCADGSRELFANAAAHPNIAGCSGGFSIAGVVTAGSMTPACGRNAGNDGAEPIGWGCSVADLCAVGWHVCVDAAEVASASGDGQCDDSSAGFWTTRQSQSREGTCTTSAVNNLVGCGASIGDDPGASCAPLNRELREQHCGPSCAWLCGSDSGIFNEAQIVQKYGSEEGGALCCRD